MIVKFSFFFFNLGTYQKTTTEPPDNIFDEPEVTGETYIVTNVYNFSDM